MATAEQVALVAVEPVASGPDAEQLEAVVHAQAEQSAGLGNRAARGALVTIGGQGARILVQLASVVVLVRLLTPRDYGLLALILVVVGVGEILRDFGLSTAAIQAKTLAREQRDGLFWLNGSLGVGFAIIVFAGAPLYARAFHQAPLEHMVQAVSITFVINGFAAQYRADLNRRMKFGKIASSDLLGQVAGLCVGITLASLGAGYWSLVAQQLAQVATTGSVLALWAGWVPGRPRRHIGLGPMLKMGSHIAATRILYYALNNLDTLVIGTRFSSAALGDYNRAFQLMNQPLNQTLVPATTVAMPVLSRLQDDYERAGAYVARAQLAIGYSVVPILAVAAGAAHETVSLLLGSRWTQVAPIFALLAVAGCLSTLAYVGSWVYVSRGLARQLMQYTAVSFVLQLVCILIGSKWGVIGVAWGYMTASALEWPLSLVWLSRRTPLPVATLLQGAGRICLTGAGAGLAAYFSHRLIPLDSPIAGLLVALVAAAAWYGACAYVSGTVRADFAGVGDFGRRMVRRG